MLLPDQADDRAGVGGGKDRDLERVGAAVRSGTAVRKDACVDVRSGFAAAEGAEAVRAAGGAGRVFQDGFPDGGAECLRIIPADGEAQGEVRRPVTVFLKARFCDLLVVKAVPEHKVRPLLLRAVSEFAQDRDDPAVKMPCFLTEFRKKEVRGVFLFF